MSPLTLRDFTPARVEIDHTGHSLKTADLLALRAAHAQARDAVEKILDTDDVIGQVSSRFPDHVVVHSEAQDRTTYLHRPDLGRRLDEQSRKLISSRHGNYDLVFVLADGLSAAAVEKHAARVLYALKAGLAKADWSIAPVVVVEQGRVAIGDEIGHLLGARQSLVLIGERPGMSSPDSLGAYLTWDPHRGVSDACRNCVSNIRDGGLSHEEAAHKILFLLAEARTRKLSGVLLKEDADQLLKAESINLLPSTGLNEGG
jgi:ethanolamine ammonia-lyase small subunit